MMGTAEPPVFRQSLAETGFAWFLRAVALYCLLFGVLYWVRLIGIYPGDLWRFDLMPVHWQIAAIVLAVLYPFAAIGLWMLASWGPVVWVVCAAIEITMYGILGNLYGGRWMVAAAHLAVAAIYMGFRIVIWRQKRKRDGTAA